MKSDVWCLVLGVSRAVHLILSEQRELGNALDFGIRVDTFRVPQGLRHLGNLHVFLQHLVPMKALPVSELLLVLHVHLLDRLRQVQNFVHEFL